MFREACKAGGPPSRHGLLSSCTRRVPSSIRGVPYVAHVPRAVLGASAHPGALPLTSSRCANGRLCRTILSHAIAGLATCITLLHNTSPWQYVCAWRQIPGAASLQKVTRRDVLACMGCTRLRKMALLCQHNGSGGGNGTHRAVGPQSESAQNIRGHERGFERSGVAWQCGVRCGPPPPG